MLARDDNQNCVLRARTSLLSALTFLMRARWLRRFSAGVSANLLSALLLSVKSLPELSLRDIERTRHVEGNAAARRVCIVGRQERTGVSDAQRLGLDGG